MTVMMNNAYAKQTDQFHQPAQAKYYPVDFPKD